MVSLVDAAEPEGRMTAMLDAIRADFRETQHYTGRAAPAERVMRALQRVPRDRYVPEGSRTAAYFNRPLRIGHGQTISQPFIVALMTDVLELEPDDRVLEIGTGSGYQAAVLAELAAEVHTVEIIPELAAEAAIRLREQGYDSVHVHTGNGWFGWVDAAPYDAIIVTAAAESLPKRLVEQLASDARMVYPVGPQDGGQTLMLLTKDAAGAVETKDLLPVMFVPLTGER